MKMSVYAFTILAVVSMEGCNPRHISMENHLKLSKSSFAPLVDAIEYWRIVGVLRYLVSTRSDLTYSVGYVSRFMEKPMTEHLLAIKRVLRYIEGTMDIGCHYEKDGEGGLVGFKNCDLADANLITWQSQKQRLVALSSCKAKYIAATMTACQGIWLGRLMAEFKDRIKLVHSC
jgi:hypothetical protein